jgi:hypothetical protein
MNSNFRFPESDHDGDKVHLGQVFREIRNRFPVEPHSHPKRRWAAIILSCIIVFAFGVYLAITFNSSKSADSTRSDIVSVLQPDADSGNAASEEVFESAEKQKLPSNIDVITATNSILNPGAIKRSRSIVIAVSPLFPPSTKTRLFQDIIDLVQSDRCRGDSVTVINGLDVQMISIIVIPESAENAPQMPPTYLSSAIEPIRAFLSEKNQYRPDSEGVLDVPKILDFISQDPQRQSTPCHLVLIGSPLFNHSASAFDMTSGRVPSDAYLRLNPSQSPYGVFGRDSFLKGFVCHFCIDEARFFSSSHRNATMRFWTYFIQLQGGDVASIGSNMTSAFESVLKDTREKFGFSPLEASDSSMTMLEFPRPGAVVMNGQTAKAPETLIPSDKRSAQTPVVSTPVSSKTTTWPTDRLATAAWAAFSQNRFNEAILNSNQCIDRFFHEAVALQKKLELDGKPTPVGEISSADADSIRSRGVLNDVGTCLFIKGRSLERIQRMEEAVQTYKQLVQLTHARCYDPGGWFWSPAAAGNDRLEEVLRESRPN